jgi:hypothetical protein
MGYVFRLIYIYISIIGLITKKMENSWLYGLQVSNLKYNIM